MRVRTARKAKAIGNTGKAIVKSSAASIQQMSCPRCGQMAVPTKLADGRDAHRCQACGSVFSCRNL